MRSFFVLLLLAVLLVTAALVTRSGILWRENSGRPINSAMREALNRRAPQWNADDERLVNEQYGNAHKHPSGMRYVVRAPGTGNLTPSVGAEAASCCKRKNFNCNCSRVSAKAGLSGMQATGHSCTHCGSSKCPTHSVHLWGSIS